MTTLDTHSWQNAEVVSTRYVADDILRIALRPTKPTAVKPGEHVKGQVWIDGKEHTRSYSIVDATDDGTEILMTVFMIPDSRGGCIFLHWHSILVILRVQ